MRKSIFYVVATISKSKAIFEGDFTTQATLFVEPRQLNQSIQKLIDEYIYCYGVSKDDIELNIINLMTDYVDEDKTITVFEWGKFFNSLNDDELAQFADILKTGLKKIRRVQASRETEIENE